MDSRLHDSLLLAIGVLCLYFGAAWLVRGSSGLARKLQVRPLIIGLTVVAYGTSAPELVVGIGAALDGRGGIAFGNAVGSNIANLGLILGLTAIISPPKVDAGLLRRELPMMVMSTLVVPILLIDGHVSRIEGGVLVLIAAAYTFFMIRGGRDTNKPAEANRQSAKMDVQEEAASSATGGGAGRRRKPDSTLKLVLLTLLGLGLLLVGGKWLVDGASHLAIALGMSERLVGLTIVAVGTSLPELATSILAARRGHSEIAVGNVIGSNIFNVLLILGASGIAGPLEVSLREARTDLGALVMITLVGAVFLRGERRLQRWEGVVLVTLYLMTLGTLIVTTTAAVVAPPHAP